MNEDTEDLSDSPQPAKGGLVNDVNTSPPPCYDAETEEIKLFPVLDNSAVAQLNNIDADWLTPQSDDEIAKVRARVAKALDAKDATVNPNPTALIDDPLAYLKQLETEELRAPAPTAELVYLRQLDKSPDTPNLVIAIPKPLPPALLIPIINTLGEGGEDSGEQSFAAALLFCRKMVRLVKVNEQGIDQPIALGRNDWIRLFNQHPILATYMQNRFGALMLEAMGVTKAALGED